MSNAALFLVPALIWGSTWHAITWQLGMVAEEVSVTYRFAAALGVLLAVLGNWLALRPQPEAAAPRDGEATPAAASRPR